jgi:hypothetical protein
LNIGRNSFGDGDSILEAVKKHSKLKHINDEGTKLKNPKSHVGHAVRTLLKGECVTSKWSEWSVCEGACGAHGKVSRTRSLLHRPHHRHLPKDESCPVELYDEKQCQVRCRNGQKIDHKQSVRQIKHKHYGDGSEEEENFAPESPALEDGEEKKKDKKHKTGRKLLTNEDDEEEAGEAHELEGGSVFGRLFNAFGGHVDAPAEPVADAVVEEAVAEPVADTVVENAVAEPVADAVVEAKKKFNIEVSAPIKHTIKAE